MWGKHGACGGSVGSSASTSIHQPLRPLWLPKSIRRMSTGASSTSTSTSTTEAAAATTGLCPNSIAPDPDLCRLNAIFAQFVFMTAHVYASFDFDFARTLDFFIDLSGSGSGT